MAIFTDYLEQQLDISSDCLHTNYGAHKMCEACAESARGNATASIFDFI